MVGMGYSREEIHESLTRMKYDEITATYLLLGRKSTELEASDSSSSSNLSLAKARPNSEHNNGQSPSHLKVQRSISSNQKQRRYSDQAGPAIPSVGYPKRSQTTAADSDLKEEASSGTQPRKAGSSGSRGMAPPSPLLGTANNPNKADIPDRKKGTAATSSTVSSSMTRRNTYVCSERNATDRHSVIQNGKENSTASAVPSQRGHAGGAGASTHSVSSGSGSGATPPDRLRFPRGTASRSTFHGGQLRERRTATYNGPPASPTLSHDATPLSQARSRGSTNLFTKLTSKLTRRVMPRAAPWLTAKSELIDAPALAAHPSAHSPLHAHTHPHMQMHMYPHTHTLPLDPQQHYLLLPIPTQSWSWVFPETLLAQHGVPPESPSDSPVLAHRTPSLGPLL
ncbi:hypothetical protein ACEWY4_022133 [Coilia grayii]|uniref:non-specific serine/threonine protein kinase n=1 Tax=Coilia grayii TaxID=363190 RepID=A0ABD1J6Z2_9TELE